ncbi:MAG TPA: ADP-ribosylglycohydrolase family protein [Mycobacteriales bacterium]|nr:ADP-ribosylglycohydrolase family protein [Mycobacteriales bacterium]
MHLSTLQMDRAVGTLLGAATGDALGVPYEFGSTRLDPPARMLGGGLGGYAPGQWSDDTEMAVCIAEVAATGADLRSAEALDDVARGFLRWYGHGPADIGVQTRRVLGQAQRAGNQNAETLRRLAADLHRETGRTAGNGSLMRTAPVALAHLGDAEAIDEAARAISALTHHDPVSGEACVLWCVAIDHAVRTGELDVRVGLPRVGDMWPALLDEAETVEPAHYAASNGWVVAALLAAWSAVSRATSFDDGVQRAVAGGGDTDTVAAIAGALLGARFGGSGVPARYRRLLHGWPGLRARDLVRLAALTVRGGKSDPDGWPAGESLASYAGAETTVVPHPDDDGVLLGAVGALRPGVADAVVSLCRLGRTQVPLAGVASEDHVEVWLVDKDDANIDLRCVLDDAATAVRDLRAEGKTVFLHCVHRHTRTPVVAAVYGALVAGGSEREALRRVQDVLPPARRPRESIADVLSGTRRQGQ